MILVHHTSTGERRAVDLQDLFHGQTCILVGGSPSLLTQNLRLLESRGVLTMAINNAARHFQPTLWISGDPPRCYEPQILLDPRITKFAPLHTAEMPVNNRPYWNNPNLFFYTAESNVPREEYLKNRASVPWYSNTLMAGIYVLYRLGVRRIVLAGSDFGAGQPTATEPDGSMYAHATSLSEFERKWNMDVYNELVKDIRTLKPYFEANGLTLMDASVNSRLTSVYPHITLEEAVGLCRESFPREMVDPGSLPHCSKFAPQAMQEKIAAWRGQVVDLRPFKQGETC